MISAEMMGEKLLVTRLEVLPTALIKRVDEAIGSATLRLSRLAQQKVSSDILKTVVMRGTFVRKTSWGIIGSVGATGATKKMAILAGSVEHGSDHPARVLEALNAAKLRFAIGGKFKFAKQVHIPAFKIPAHSFLRAALDDLSEEIVRSVGAAAKLGV